MTTPFQPQAIDGPPAAPPGYSLLIAADTTNDDAAHTWQRGVTWAPEQIGGGGAYELQCAGNTRALGEHTNPGIMTAEPIVVWAEDHCSTTGWRTRNYEARARRQLDATQSFSIAREFQLGALRDTYSLANVALKDAVVAHPGAKDPITALAELEGILGETTKGRRGMVHVSSQVLTLLCDGHALTRAGQRWIAPMGTVVAADAGYTVESDGWFYMYATSGVEVKLGKVFLNPGSFEEAMSNGAIDRTVNKVRIYSERESLVLVDGVISGTIAGGAGSADAMFKIQLNVTPWATHS